MGAAMRQGSAAVITVAIGAALWVTTLVGAHYATTEAATICSTLEWLSPASCALSIAAVVVAAIASRDEVRRVVHLWVPQQWPWLAVIVAAALVVRLLTVPATERVYYDEHTYMQLARGIADKGRGRVACYGVIEEQRFQCVIGSYSHWSFGWPTLLAGPLRLTGYARWTGTAINLSMSLATVVLVGLLAAAFFRNTSVWVMSAEIYASLPANQVWSRTNASEVFAAFAVALAAVAAVCFAQRPSRRLGYFMMASAAMAAQSRNEMLLVVPLVTILVASFGGRRAVSRLWWPVGFLILLLLPQALHLGWVSRGYQPGVVGTAGFGQQYFARNIASVAEYVRHEPVAFICLILASIGAFKSPTRKAALPLCLWMLFAFLPALFHFGGSYTFPGGERFFLACLPPLSLWAGAGLYALHVTLIPHVHATVLAAGWTLMFLIALRWNASHTVIVDRNTQTPREDCAFLRAALCSVPDDGLVITADPPVVIAEGKSAAMVTWVGEDIVRLQEMVGRHPGGLYFYCAPSSSPDHWPGGAQAENHVLSVVQKIIVREQIAPQGRRVLYRLFVNDKSLIK